MTQIIIVAVLVGFGIAVIVGLFLINRDKASASGKDSSSNKASTADAPHHSSGDGGGDGGGD